MRKVYMNILPLYVQDGQIWVKNICLKQLRRCAYNHSLLPEPPFSWLEHESYKKCGENFGMTLVMSADLFLFTWSAISGNFVVKIQMIYWYWIMWWCDVDEMTSTWQAQFQGLWTRATFGWSKWSMLNLHHLHHVSCCHHNISTVTKLPQYQHVCNNIDTIKSLLNQDYTLLNKEPCLHKWCRSQVFQTEQERLEMWVRIDRWK